MPAPFRFCLSRDKMRMSGDPLPPVPRISRTSTQKEREPKMAYLVMEYVLTFGTIGFVAALAYVNKRQTDKMLDKTRARSAQARLVAAE